LKETGGFEDIVREHQAMVFSIGYHFLQDRTAAEELAQDVFLQLYRDLGKLETPVHVARWLRKVACHRSIDYARRRKLRPQVGLDQAPEPVSEPAAADPMLSRRLRALVASLPEKTRMIVILRFQEELEIEEIARVMSIPAGTVKSQLQRGLAKLREKFTRVFAEVAV
jgi:RNA polymerase sigma-70 factor, ECF subfamily